MTKLAVIVGIGGINAAGRSSGFHSYKRMVCESLPEAELNNTWCDLAYRMGLGVVESPTAEQIDTIKNNTLIRRITAFDPDCVTIHHKVRLDVSASPSQFILHKSKLPNPLPLGWTVEELEKNDVRVTTTRPVELLLPSQSSLGVSSAGSLPTGFDPGALYHSNHHPRGIKLAIYGVSDALNSLGLPWEALFDHIKPDEVSVYAGSGLTQIDEYSLSGLIAEPLKGNRITSKMLPLSLAEMPADFINSYVINSVGNTGTNMGACASFLYNLKQGMQDIQQNKAKVVIVGNSEAPIVPELIEGFRQMGALINDADLCRLDNAEKPDNRRACRPFSTNSGFTLAESAQFVVLMNDELALTLGMTIYGAVADVFINADANKRSITAPGVGNYITFAKATALARAILGQQGLQQTFVQAHGTGTPLNRTSESHIINEVAKTFAITQWPVTAIKSYVGHSVSAAAGDQLIASLGVWQYGFIPGIKSIDHLADDVHTSHLNILMQDHYAGQNGSDMQAVLINSKGFGGNNATGLILSPDKTLSMLENRYGSEMIKQYQKNNKAIKTTAARLDKQTCSAQEPIRYTFGTCVMDDQSIRLSPTQIQLSTFPKAVQLATDNPYWEYEKAD